MQVRTKAAYRCSRFYDAATKSLVPPSPGVPAQLLSEDEISEDIEVCCSFCVWCPVLKYYVVLAAVASAPLQLAWLWLKLARSITCASCCTHLMELFYAFRLRSLGQ